MSVARKFFVGLGGGVIIIFGLILIPTPAPEGWLIVFAGIALLSTEFSFAKRLMKRVKMLRQKCNRWIQRQPLFLQTGLNIVGILMLVGFIVLGSWLMVRMFL
ncbi:MAG: PGPGW domain-containing protein [Candidatus Microsaccharimonas sp.]